MLGDVEDSIFEHLQHLHTNTKQVKQAIKRGTPKRGVCNSDFDIDSSSRINVHDTLEMGICMLQMDLERPGAVLKNAVLDQTYY